MTRRRVLVVLSFVLLGILAAAVVLTRRSYEHKPIPSETSASAVAVSSAESKRTWPTPFSVELRGLPPREDLPPDTLRVLVVGDSVAKFLGLALRYRQDERKSFVAERGVGDCSIFAEKPYIENGQQKMSSSCSKNWASDAAELRPDVTLVVMGGGFFSHGACTKAFQLEYEKRLVELAEAMGDNAGQLVITRVPYPVKAWRHSNVLERVDCFNEMLVSIARKNHWEMVDLMRHVCPTRDCNMQSEGKPIRPDGLHFDGGGTEETARWVLDELWRVHKKAAHQ